MNNVLVFITGILATGAAVLGVTLARIPTDKMDQFFEDANPWKSIVYVDRNVTRHSTVEECRERFPELEKVANTPEVKFITKNVPCTEESTGTSKLKVRRTDTYIVRRGGSKSWRNNNPFNISCMSGRRYGAIGIAVTGTGDKGDQKMCVFSSLSAGSRAFDILVSRYYSKGSIKEEFDRYQTDKASFKRKLEDLKSVGINVNKSYKTLSRNQRLKFKKVWKKHEGFKAGTIYVASHKLSKLVPTHRFKK